MNGIGPNGPYTRNETRMSAICTLLHLLVTLPLAWYLNLQADEGSSLITTSHGLAESIRQALSFEQQPPLYFAALHMWRSLFGDSVFAARLLSVICAAGVVVATVAISRRYLPRVHSPRLAAVIALHPFIVWSAVEIRPYAAILLLAALLLITFHDGFVAGADRVDRHTELVRCRSRVWCLVLGVAALYTHYYSGFLLVAAATALVACRRWYSLKVYLATMCVAGLCLIPLVPAVFSQVAERTSVAGSFAGVWESARHVYWHAVHLLLPLAVNASDLQMELCGRVWGYVIIALSVGCAWRFRRLFVWKHNDVLFWNDNVVLSSMSVVLLLCFAAITLAIGPDKVLPRHTVVLLIPVVLASFALTAALTGNRGVGWWSCVMMCFSVSALLTTYQSLSKPGDWKAVASHIQRLEKGNEPVLIFWPWVEPAFRVHYEGVNRIVAVPTAETFHTFDVRDYAIKSPEMLHEAIEQAGLNADTVWLVTCGPLVHQGIDLGWENLEAWVQSEFLVEVDQQFHGSRVRRLNRRGRSAASTSHKEVVSDQQSDRQRIGAVGASISGAAL